MDLSAVRWFEDKESATAPHRPAFEAMQAVVTVRGLIHQVAALGEAFGQIGRGRTVVLDEQDVHGGDVKG